MSKKDKAAIQSGDACPMKKTSIGGQALMEGIMMRGPKMTAMAVRNPQGEIVVEKFPTAAKKRSAFFRIPFVRGIFNFADSMAFGYKCLMRSAEISGLEEAEAELEREKQAKKAEKLAKKAAKKGIEAPKEETVPTESAVKDAVEDTMPTETATDKTVTSADSVTSEQDAPAENSATAEAKTVEQDAKNAKSEKKKTSPLMAVIMVVSILFAVVLMVGLFILLPTFLYGLIGYLYPDVADNRFLMSAFEGIIRVLLLVGYMLAISLMKDIRRTFMYHGAEHKTIFCYERGLELTVENVKKERRFHPRCGTSFLILMVLVSIIVGFFIPPSIPKLIRAVIKIALIPVIVGIGYELIKFCGKYDNWLTRVISAPGVALQHLTVFEPDDDMIECAIAAMKEVIPEDNSDKW